MKTYLLSVDPSKFDAVAALLQQQPLTVVNVLAAISVIVVSCEDDQKNRLAQTDGILAVEEEGTSFAI